MIRTREAFLRVVGDLPSGIQVRLHLRYADYAASRPFLKTMDPDMVSLEGYLRHLPPSRLWVNPDYGLKTRRPKAVGNLIGGEDG